MKFAILADTSIRGVYTDHGRPRKGVINIDNGVPRRFKGGEIYETTDKKEIEILSSSTAAQPYFDKDAMRKKLEALSFRPGAPGRAQLVALAKSRGVSSYRKSKAQLIDDIMDTVP